MTRLQSVTLAAVATALAVAACGKKPDNTPTPVATTAPDTAAENAKRRADSLAQAQADSMARARAMADSIARARAADSAAAASHSADEVRAMLATMIHFEFNKSDIQAADQAVLDQKIAILQKNPGLRIQVAGNCDERGSQEYNLALGNRRANAAKQYLVTHGIDAGRVETVSNGEERPLDPGHTEEAWAKNRRDEFTILAGGDALVKP
ncbi:MAG TPA: peptidoglycan-associated lipoprotein Pal [Gemmatimonadales bacterium]|nr:peptidoglycan-associated lipoprotein Pal [Gemmatimonadales bacterium]